MRSSVLRHGAAEDVDFAHARRQSCFAHLCQLGPRDVEIRRRQADRSRDAHGGGGVVAGDHHDADTGGLRFRDRGRHRLAYWIGKADEPDEAERKIVLQRRQLAEPEGCLGHAQHPQSLRGHRRRRARQRGDGPGRQMAEVDDRLGCALRRDHIVGAIGRLPHARDREQLRRQRIFVDERPVEMNVLGAAEEPRRGRLDRLVHRVERIALACEHREFEELVEMLGQPGIGRRRDGDLLAAGVQRGERHPVLRQRAGLVDAQHGRRSQHLERRHVSCQHAVAGDAPGAEPQEDGEDDGQLLRQDRHRQRDAGKDRLQPLAVHQPVGERDQHAQSRAPPCDALHDAGGLPLDARGFGPDRREHAADPSQRGLRAGREDARHALALHDERAGEHERRLLASRRAHALHGFRRGELAYRHRFAGEERLVHRKIRRAANHRVGRDAIALGEHEKVADHDLAPGDAPLLAVADHERPRARQITQRLERTLALAFLDERDADDHEHEREQHRRFALVAQQQIDDAAGDQQQEHRLAHDVGRDREHAPRLRRGQFVGTVAREAGGCFSRGKACVGECIRHDWSQPPDSALAMRDA